MGISKPFTLALRATAVSTLVVGLAALAPVQAGANSERVTGTTQVGQKNLQFNPFELKVPVGETVVWTNHETDATIHSVVQQGGSDINSPDIGPNEHFEWTFTDAGAYTLTCRFHPDMFMTVDVGGKAAPAKPAKKLTPAQKKAAEKKAKKAAKAAAKKAAAESHDVHEEGAKKSIPAAPPGPPESTIPGIGGLPFSPQN